MIESDAFQKMDAAKQLRLNVLDSLIGVLERGVVIISRLDDPEYATGRDDESSIGAHIRHNLDFVNALLRGVDRRRIDYNARTRDRRLETDREYAIKQLQIACLRLRNITTGIRAHLVMVRSEIDLDVWHASSVSRELEFLHSHSIHHYALVARLLDGKHSNE